MTKIVCVIPARAGSKGIPNKNIVTLGGFPLIAYSIAASLGSSFITETIVSTDCSNIASIATSFGAEVPFLRPDEFAQDESTDLDFFNHLISWYDSQSRELPDIFIHLRPTTPLREISVIDDAIRVFLSDETATSMKSVSKVAESPHKMFFMKNNYLVGLYPNEKRLEYFNLPRQAFPSVYLPNGYIDIVKPSYIREKGLLSGSKIRGYFTPYVTEVDQEKDLSILRREVVDSKVSSLTYLKKNYGENE
ncbi:acylneuraminate cytidylyltransferase family protein [bacterium]|jgi:CMP-N,N'-diacetyllegionaminic acid synthase|nr:acylneuraminate cytidylyltransferase family protein [bacterium]